MRNAKIVLVAEWVGWCGACADDRPLVLTRTGRQRLRTWLTGAADDSRPLVLTCRLCGTGVDIPLEQDDPPVTLDVDAQEPVAAAAPPVTEATSAAVDVAEAVTAPLQVPIPASTTAAELTAGRQALAQALGGLLAQRRAAAPVPSSTPGTQPVPVPQVATVPVAPAAAPVLPLQRTPSGGGLAELQLLADGIDLLSTGRA